MRLSITLFFAGVLVVSGCTRAKYFAQADAEAQQIVAEERRGMHQRLVVAVVSDHDKAEAYGSLFYSELFGLDGVKGDRHDH